MEPDYSVLNPEIVDYIRDNIFSRYNPANGHGLDHIKNVARRSLDLAKRINDGSIKTTAKDFKNLPEELKNPRKIDYDMSFVIASYHDLGREKNNKLHHLISAAWLLDDDFIEDHFSRDKLRVMADAVMDHRASNELVPATIYGKIVSSADRDTDCYDIMRRAYAYNRHVYPDKTESEARDYCYEKICIKFANKDAYGAKKMFFDNPEFDAMVKKFQEICVDRATFDVELDKALGKD